MRNAAIDALRGGVISCNEAYDIIREGEERGSMLMLISTLSLTTLFVGPLSKGGTSVVTGAAGKFFSSGVGKFSLNLLQNSAIEFATHYFEKSVHFDSPAAQQVWDENIRDLSGVLTSIAMGAAIDVAMPKIHGVASEVVSHAVSPVKKFYKAIKMRKTIGFDTHSMEKLMKAGDIPSNQLANHPELLDLEIKARNKLPMRNSADPDFDIEVEMPNGHTWKRTKGGKGWCRNPDIHCFHDSGEPGSLFNDPRVDQTGKANAGTKGADQRVDVSERDIADMRRRYQIDPSSDTLAIARTDVPGLEREVIEGGSPKRRENADIPQPTPYVKSPRTNKQFVDHAEQDVVNGFIDRV
ncbi:MAG: hypothetical protein EOO00_09700, partial [Chitinophagaceae bacterium]